MSEKIQIQLNKYKNINSVNVDNYQHVELTNKILPITEYDIRNVLSVSELFNVERDENQIYRIYGRIEYLSLLNGLAFNYSGVTNFFSPQISNSKNVFNSFYFYLLKAASSGYTQMTGNSTQYARLFEVIATPDNFEVYNAGYSNNVYGEQTYAFNFNIDINISSFVDNFNFPATEVYLYCIYKQSGNYYNEPELMRYTNFGLNGVEVIQQFNYRKLNIGDKVYGDLIEYSKTEFQQFQVLPQKYYIYTPFHNESDSETYLHWKYNPILPITLQYFSSSLDIVNTGSTSYDILTSIPYYATYLGEGNYVWREILPQGINDLTTGLGVNCPFVNMKRYLFTNIILSISPDLSDGNTERAFEQIKYPESKPISFVPSGGLNNIGVPCQ